jgi:hypothetical protein
MTRRIDTYTHRCTVQHGDMAGNKVSREVTSWDYEYGETCQYCDEPLVTTEQLLAHIYRELTEE